MCKYTTFLFYAILNFIAVPCAFSQAAADGSTINLSGEVINPPKCVVNGGADFNISLKTMRSNEISSGFRGFLAPNEKHGTAFSIPIYCSGLAGNGFKMYLTGDTSNIDTGSTVTSGVESVFVNNSVFGSDLADISLLIKIKNYRGDYVGYKKNNVIIFPFVSGFSSVDFKSFLLKSYNKLPSGNFSVTLSVVFMYQ